MNWLNNYSDKIEDLIKGRYPLTVIRSESLIIMQGPIELNDLNGNLIDSYSVEIEILGPFPEMLPTVKEVGGRIPRIADRHVYENGNLCLIIPDEIWKFCPPGSTIVDYIEKLLKPFLISQSYFEETGEWIFGQRPHRGMGIIDYYKEELSTDDDLVALRFLKYLSEKMIRPRWLCYCGSGKRLQDCHLLKLAQIRSVIPYKTALHSLTQIQKEVKSG